MKTKRTIPSKFIRIIAALLIAGHSFMTLALPHSAKAATAPGLVASFSAPSTDDQIALSWEAPLDDGGSPVTGYLARIRLSGEVGWSSMVMQSDQLAVAFAGLTIGEQYDVAVAATNAIGTGEDTEILSITVGSVPDVVENLQFIDNGDSVLRATWNPPTNPGSSAVTGYEFAYSLSEAESWDPYTVSEPSAMIIGLDPELYDIRVRAISSIGAGDWTYLRYQYLGDVSYDVSTCEELQAIRYVPDAIYNLMNDIDCTGVDFVPIGTINNPFTGTLEGHNFTISNLTVNAPMDYVGLFGVAGLSTIQNFTINGSVTGGDYAGGLAGKVSDAATITNVTSNMAINGGDYSGGLVGYAAGLDVDYLEITDSSATGIVLGDEAVGGLVGYATATAFLSSHASGLTTSAGDYAGGLVGRSLLNTISRSYATGATTSQQTRAGGLVGESEQDTISDSYARGSATTPNIYYAGGLIGAMNNSDLSRVYSTGVVNGYGIIGGLVGYNVGGSSITDSFSASYVLPQDGGWDARANNGMVGIDYANEITYTNSFFNSINVNPNCARDDSFNIVTSSDCTGFNLQFNETMFKEADDAPISNWDIGGTWRLNADDFPTLNPTTEPYILCEQSLVTNNSVSVHCAAEPEGWGATTWEMQYKKTSASTWNTVTLNDPAVAQATIGNLIAGTDYQVRFRFTNNWGTSQWGRIDATTSGIAPVESITSPISSVVSATTPLAVIEQVEAESGKIYLNDFSEFKSATGKTLELSLGQIVYFYVHGELHSATITEIGPDYVIVRIASEPQDVRISVGQAQEVSVLQNGSKDLRVSLVSVQEGKATLNFAELTVPPVVTSATKPVNTNMAWWLFLLIIPVGYYLAGHKSPSRRKHA